MNTHTIQEQLKQKYTAEPKRARERKTGCCGEESHQKESDPITSHLYGQNETGWLPETAISASLGCGDPSFLAKLNPERD